MGLPIRIDATTLPALIFGGILLITAIVWAIFIRRARNAIELMPEMDDRERLHAYRQCRRRLQVSSMLGLVGVLIPLGDQLDKEFLKHPQLFFMWLLSVFVLVIWMVLMALGDWLSTIAYTAVERTNLRHQRRELEEVIRRYHVAKNGNADSIDGGDNT